MKSKWKITGIIAILILGVFLVASCGGPSPTPSPQASPTTQKPAATTPISTQATPKPATTTSATQPTPSPSIVALGGKLYDNWMKTAQVATPQGNSPIWASQTTNTRTGSDTWRCKECHGWDYRGKDGAYGKGSHLTGFPGVYNAATTKTPAELTAILKGSSNPNHNFSTYLTDDKISALASFIKAGAAVDETQFIDYATKKPKSADPAKGKQLYDSSCSACHGSDGKQILFDGKDTLGFLAKDNPWETVHKIRFGQPGAGMPSGVEQQWSMQNTIDILSHAQTLP